MHYESRPTWRYQWSAVLAILIALAVMTLAVMYGPNYLGQRVTDLVSTAAGALSVYFLLLMFYRHLSWRYLVDDQNIESYQGVLARHVRSIRVEDLRSVNVQQSVMQRLFDVGDVEFSSSAGGDIEVVFFGVSDPMHVKELVRKMQSGTPPSIAE